MRLTPPAWALSAAIWLASGSRAAPPTVRYAIIEVDRFVPVAGVALPFENRNALADDIAREISVEFPTVLIVRQDHPAGTSDPVLRISGTVLDITARSTARKLLLGVGGPAVQAVVRLADSKSGRTLADRGFACDLGSLARRIAKFCNDTRLICSK